MLVSNFTPSLSIVYGQSNDEISSIESEEQLDNNENLTNEEETHTLTIHYNRKNSDYDGWDLWWWTEGLAGSSYAFTGEDDFGKIIEMELNSDQEYKYILRKDNGQNWDKNHQKDQSIKISEDTEIWITQGQDGYRMCQI